MKLELFGCAGGMALGFRRAGIEFDLVVDKDPDACESYTQNVGHRPIEMDVRDLFPFIAHFAPKTPVELLVADPPCTPWSRAGKRKGLEDERDMLRETVQMIRLLRPTCWLIGNVPGLDDGPNWPIVQKVIGGLAPAWCVDYVRLDAVNYGVPQFRERPFWFGHPAGSACIRWPAPSHADLRELGHAELGETRTPWITCRQALSHLPIEELGQPIRVRWKSESYAPSRIDEPSKVVPASQPGNRGAVLNVGHVNHRLSVIDEPARCQTTNTHTDGALLAHPKHPINSADAPSFTVDAKGCRGAQGATVCSWPWDRPSVTVVASEKIDPPQRFGPNRARGPNAIKLSDRARAILQGFPDGAVFTGETKASRAAQIGMAMPPPLAAAVARSIVRWFMEHNAKGLEASA